MVTFNETDSKDRGAALSTSQTGYGMSKPKRLALQSSCALSFTFRSTVRPELTVRCLLNCWTPHHSSTPAVIVPAVVQSISSWNFQYKVNVPASWLQWQSFWVMWYA